MTSSIRLLVLGAMCVCAPALSAQHSSFFDGTTHHVQSPIAPVATGLAMTNMAVRWQYTDLSFSHGVWGDLGGNLCGVSDGGFELTMACDGTTSLNSTWSFANSTDRYIIGFTLNGASANIAFDCGFAVGACVPASLGDAWGTSGSLSGLSLKGVGGSLDVDDGYGEYRNRVGLNGAAPVGDLFEEFSLKFHVVSPGESYQFQIDTDIATYAPNDFAPPPPGGGQPVPEPSSTSLLLASLAALLVGVHRRRGRA